MSAFFVLPSAAATWMPRLPASRQLAFLHHVLHREPALDDEEAVGLLDHEADEGHRR